MHEIESKNYRGHLDTVWKDLDNMVDKKREVSEGI
jgi:hypothetical protein